MENHRLHNEDDLKHGASLGDESAFRELFDYYHQRLYIYILKMVKSKEAAEELVMDVFLKLWLGRDMLPEIENLNAFLFRVAYNRTIDFFRSAASDKNFTELVAERIEQLSESPDVVDKMVSKEYEEWLREAINRLPQRRRVIYELSRDSELSHDEISAKLNISKSTVANSIVKARQFIKEYLRKNVDLLSSWIL